MERSPVDSTVADVTDNIQEPEEGMKLSRDVLIHNVKPRLTVASQNAQLAAGVEENNLDNMNLHRRSVPGNPKIPLQPIIRGVTSNEVLSWTSSGGCSKLNVSDASHNGQYHKGQAGNTLGLQGRKW